MEAMGLKTPPTRVNLQEIAAKYHAAEAAQEKRTGTGKAANKRGAKT